MTDIVGSAGDDSLSGGAGPDSISGLGGNDTLLGAAGFDVLDGGAGADRLDGGDDNDNLYGQAGDDTAQGGAGNDYLVGGAGNDLLDGGGGIDAAGYYDATGGVQVNLTIAGVQAIGADQGNDTLVSIENLAGGAFNDTLSGDGGANVLSGLAGDDSLHGQAGVDNLLGDAGADVLDGGDDNDFVQGAAGDDTVRGGAGDDQLLGGAGADLMDGGAGADMAIYSGATAGISVSLAIAGAQAVGADQGVDTLVNIENLAGGAFNDTLSGDGGANVLAGLAGDDSLHGQAGVDNLLGDVGADVLDGGDDNDFVKGADGDDTVRGGAGDDQLLGGAGADLMDGGAGAADIAIYSSATAGISVSLAVAGAQAVGADQGADTLVNIEQLLGSAFADTLTGDSNSNFLGGSGGDDSLTAGAGDDALRGGAGDDVLDGGSNTPVIGQRNAVGGDGALYDDATGGVIVSLSAVGAQAVGGGAGVDTLINIENLRGGAFSDQLTGDTQDNYVGGSAGADTIQGLDGADVVEGGQGDDRLDGGAGKDLAAYITGTAGVTVDLSVATGQDVGGGLGVDTLVSVESLYGSAFGDQLTGDGQDNYIDGQAGADTVSGAGGADELFGAGGADSLSGGEGDDTLSGEAGDDTLSGAGGVDTVTFSGAQADYQIQFQADSVTVTDLRSGSPDGTDTISGAEFLKFSDVTVPGSPATLALSPASISQPEGNSGSTAFTFTITRAGNLTIATSVDWSVAVTSPNIPNPAQASDFSGGALPAGTATFAVGESTKTVTVNVAGDATVEVPEQFMVTLANADNGAVILAASARGVILNDDTAYALLSPTVTAAEGDSGSTAFIFAVTRSGDVSYASTIQWSVTGSGPSPAAATDFAGGLLPQGSISFLNGQITKFITISVAGDLSVEATEQFTLTLSSPIPGSGTSITAPTAIGVITNDDAAPAQYIVLGNYNIATAAGGVEQLGAVVGGPSSFAGGSNLDLAAGAFTGLAGLPTGISSLSTWQAFATALSAKTTEVSTTGVSVYLDTALFVGAGGAGADLFAIANVQAATVTGGAGDDTISTNLGGAATADVISGGTGNDTLSGGGGTDTLDGGADDDRLSGGPGNDRLDGGSGVDTVDYSASTGGVSVNLAFAGPYDSGVTGVDTLLNIENVIGGNFADLLTGNGQANRLDGGAGVDFLNGGLGNDTLVGGAGFDLAVYLGGGVTSGVVVDLVSGTASGGAGQDQLSGIEGIQGSSFNDSLTGDSAVNQILGNNGDDTLVGGLGDDTLAGGSGIDTVSYVSATGGVTVFLGLPGGATGAAGNDVIIDVENLEGSEFADLLLDNLGVSNVLKGFGGDDFIAPNFGNDTVDGGAGIDTLSYRGTNVNPVKVNLAITSAQVTNFGSLTVTNVENLIGTTLTDTLAGNAQANRIEGAAGADSLSGAGGDDTIDGGAGGDRMDGGAGIDTVSYASAAAAVTVDFHNYATYGSGVFTLSGDASGDLFGGVERFEMGAFGDLFGGISAGDTVSGRDGADRLYGNAGDDALAGDAGDDYLDGNSGSDSLTGGLGADTLDGGADNDRLDGSAGIDTVTYASSSAAVKADLSILGPQATLGAGVDTLIDIENLTGTDFGDTLSGDSGGNVLTGGGGNDSLLGGDGTDTLNGGVGNDVVRGDAGADSVAGGDGADTVDGGSADDLLTGGRGADLFVFGAGFGRDTLTDFRPGEDDIRFTGARFTDFADMLAHATQAGSGVVITNAAGDSLQLNNTSISSLQSADFLFG